MIPFSTPFYYFNLKLAQLFIFYLVTPRSPTDSSHCIVKDILSSYEETDFLRHDGIKKKNGIQYIDQNLSTILRRFVVNI